MLVLFLFSLLGTLPGLNFPYHYFIISLPAFALLLGLGIEELAIVFSKVANAVGAAGLAVDRAGWKCLSAKTNIFSANTPPGHSAEL